MARPALTTEQFITKAREVHGNLYNYELVEYSGAHSKVKIICKSHGEFLQAPSHHSKGAGCPLCGNKASNKAKADAAKLDFSTKANIIHNSKYDYSLVEYMGAHSKVKIICKHHGEFLQSSNNHLSGKGCPHCALSEQGWSRTSFANKCIKNNNGLGILYVLECFNENERFIKIGITSRSVKKRYASTREMPYLYRVIDEVIGDPVEIYNLETKLHQINKENKYIPEIPFGGYATECFKEYKEK